MSTIMTNIQNYSILISQAKETFDRNQKDSKCTLKPNKKEEKDEKELRKNERGSVPYLLW